MSRAGLARWAGLLIDENNSLGPILMVHAEEWRAEAEAARIAVERAETARAAAGVPAEVAAMPNITAQDLFAKIGAIGAAAVQSAMPLVFGSTEGLWRALPPLPEPCFRTSTTGGAFDHDQMRAYAVVCIAADHERLRGIEDEWARLSQDEGKAAREIERLRSDRDCEKRLRKDAEERREEAADEIAKLRRALEIIAVGDAPNPQSQAAEELVALGYWRGIPEARTIAHEVPGVVSP